MTGDYSNPAKKPLAKLPAGYRWKWGNCSVEARLALVYLFLSAEDGISDAGYALFEEIGKSLEGFTEMKDEVVGECEKALATGRASGKSHYEKVSEVFSSYKEEEAMDEPPSILWALMKLQCRDEVKSDKKQKLIDLWLENRQSYFLTA